MNTSIEPKSVSIKPFFWGFVTAIVSVFLLTITPLGQWSMMLIAPYQDKVAWYLMRSSGVVAYVLFGISTVSGLLMSSKLGKQLLPVPFMYQLHQVTAWIGLGLAALHGIVVLFDSYFAFTIENVLIPFTSPYQPFWVGLGVISWYLMALVISSFSVRKLVGQKNWRRLHYLTFIGFILMTLHGLVAGTDTSSAVMLSLYAGFGGSVLFLTLFRVLTGLETKKRGQQRG